MSDIKQKTYYPPSERRDAVISYIRDHDGQGVRDICEAMERMGLMSYNSAFKVVKTLQADGILTCTPVKQDRRGPPTKALGIDGDMMEQVQLDRIISELISIRKELERMNSRNGNPLELKGWGRDGESD